MKASLKATLISKYRWILLRTLLDEVAVENVVDIFILFSNEEYDERANGHRKTEESEHRTGFSLLRWNVEIENFMVNGEIGKELRENMFLMSMQEFLNLLE